MTMQRIRRRVSSGKRRNMSAFMLGYNNPGVEMANALRLRATEDMNNNVGRLCDLPGDKTPRTWRVETPLASGLYGGPVAYIVRNTITGAYRLAGTSPYFTGTNVQRMGNLY